MLIRNLCLTLLLVGISLGSVTAQTTSEEDYGRMLSFPHDGQVMQYRAVTGVWSTASNELVVKQVNTVGQPLVGVYFQRPTVNSGDTDEISIQTEGVALLSVSNTTSSSAGNAIYDDGHMVAGGAIATGEAIAINSAGIGLAINDGDQPPLGVYGVVNCIGHALEAHPGSNTGAKVIRVWISPFTLHYGSGD